jgi:RimJ/RimL family protein N-acetyltransferase
VRRAAAVVRLVTADRALLDAAVDDRPALSRALGCELADGWDVFPASLRRVRDALTADPGGVGWGTRLILVDAPATLVGWCGFKGPPRDGVVELGYAIAPSLEGRGLATAAVRELLGEAFAAPGVLTVIAHTLAEAGASARVLEKAGFIRDDDLAHSATWRFRHDRPPA